MTYPIQSGPSFPASKTGERPNPLSSAWDGDQKRRSSIRPGLAMPFNIATPAAATWTLNEGTI